MIRLASLSVSIHAARTGSDVITPSKISIHATHTGSDPGECAEFSESRLFLFTPPVRAATAHQQRTGHPDKISIHATRAGSDGFQIAQILLQVPIILGLAGKNRFVLQPIYHIQLYL